ncbi:arylsulfatase B-like [Diorhabda carinulata]|uniref:arylsulfatase B-like n=1 Tax=Diorhabda carinulata TaxID=1163345 RepID=UPI0025A024F3|nr:arylsulfatase B-like [Diorhabda carinulata]
MFPAQGVILLCFISNVVYTEKTTSPNIVIILADDVGWNDFGLHGSSQIPTPNIDALGYNGVILDKFYTQQTCTPSRAALLTGNYPMRLGLQGIPLNAGENRHLPLQTPTLPEKLKELGYINHLVGKWHLGAACSEYTPTKRGFDTHFGYWNGYVGYFNYEISVPDPLDPKRNFTGFDLHDNFTPKWELKGQYATDLFTKKSLEIIKNHRVEKPLFLMLAHLAGHTGYDGIELGVPDAVTANRKYHYIKSIERRSYADLVNIMDSSVGEIVGALSEKKMLQNTVILFFSDNGAQTEGLYQNFGSSWPFRGLKFTLFEGGVRGTGVLYSPLLKKKNYVNRRLIHVTDFLPTFYRVAGGDVDKLGNIDGIDQWDTISGNAPTNRTEILINIDETSGYSGVIGYGGRYKLLNGSFSNGLYNGYYGDSGRNLEDPSYNYSSVINSPTNLAIEKLTNRSLNRSIIDELRRKIDLGSCRSMNRLYLCDDLCLFDLYIDPCETTNLIDDGNLRGVVGKLYGKLSVYMKDVVPDVSHRIDPDSDPKRFNGTWSCWSKCGRDFH